MGMEKRGRELERREEKLHGTEQSWMVGRNDVRKRKQNICKPFKVLFSYCAVRMEKLHKQHTHCLQQTIRERHQSLFGSCSCSFPWKCFFFLIYDIFYSQYENVQCAKPRGKHIRYCRCHTLQHVRELFYLLSYDYTAISSRDPFSKRTDLRTSAGLISSTLNSSIARFHGIRTLASAGNWKQPVVWRAIKPSTVITQPMKSTFPQLGGW